MTMRLKDLKGRAIVDMRDGVKIGVFEDLMVSPDQLASRLLIVNKGAVFTRRLEGIPTEDVRVWGRDVILVDNQDVLRPLNSFPDYKSWVMGSEQIKQRSVVSIDGKRVGQADDLVLDTNGRITAVSLSQVYIKGPAAEMKEIPVDAVRSLGPDVVIVDLDRVHMTGLTEDMDLTPEGVHSRQTPDTAGEPQSTSDGSARVYEPENVRR